jgi:hypothetical protein
VLTALFSELELLNPVERVNISPLSLHVEEIPPHCIPNAVRRPPGRPSYSTGVREARSTPVEVVYLVLLSHVSKSVMEASHVIGIGIAPLSSDLSPIRTIPAHLRGRN